MFLEALNSSLLLGVVVGTIRRFNPHDVMYSLHYCRLLSRGVVKYFHKGALEIAPLKPRTTHFRVKSHRFITSPRNFDQYLLPLYVKSSYSTSSIPEETALERRLRTLPKGKLKKMSIDKDLLTQILTQEVMVLASLFEKNNYELRLAGGPVRDLLMGKVPEDLDFATTATPPQMKTMFEEEGIRMINTKGEKHGTITARINDKANFEVTTLRIDVVTDGRHAEVCFTTDWEVDAARRDLTVNSMFLDLNSGQVHDYFNGAEDLKVRKIRFVGKPEERIQEDYLRILRYFRFYGRLSTESDSHEQGTLAAIKDNIQGLKQISGERIWMETRKILTGNYSKEIMLRMLDLGMGPLIGLPEDPDKDEYKLVSDRIDSLNQTVNPITRLAALLRNEQEGMALHGRLKLSAFERDLCLFIILHRKIVTIENSIKPFQRLVIFTKNKPSDVRQWTEETMKYCGALNLLEEFQKWEPPKFPVSGNHLVQLNVPAGRIMSRVMTELKDIWLESNFTATTDALLAELPKVLEEVIAKHSPPPKSSKKQKAKS